MPKSKLLVLLPTAYYEVPGMYLICSAVMQPGTTLRKNILPPSLVGILIVVHVPIALRAQFRCVLLEFRRGGEVDAQWKEYEET